MFLLSTSRFAWDSLMGLSSPHCFSMPTSGIPASSNLCGLSAGLCRRFTSIWSGSCHWVLSPWATKCLLPLPPPASYCDSSGLLGSHCVVLFCSRSISGPCRTMVSPWSMGLSWAVCKPISHSMCPAKYLMKQTVLDSAPIANLKT